MVKEIVNTAMVIAYRIIQALVKKVQLVKDFIINCNFINN